MTDDWVYYRDGCIEHELVTYAEVYGPDCWLSYTDFARMWQIINLKIIKGLWSIDEN